MTNVIPTAVAPILAIDLGKYKSVACLYRSAEDLRFITVTTSRDELARLLERHQADGGAARGLSAGRLGP